MSEVWRFLTALAVSTSIGAIAWRGPLCSLALAALIPSLVFVQSGRSRAAAVALAYFGAASLPVIDAYRAFGNYTRWSVVPVLVWLVAACFLTLPWVALWTRAERPYIWRIAAASTISVVPPFGLIGWASPLVTAGVLFPGTGWLGLLATVASAGLLVSRNRRISTGILGTLAIAIANLAYFEHPLPRGWQAIRTSSSSTRVGFQPGAELSTSDALQAMVTRTSGRVLIFPEAVVTRWNVATEAFWQATIAQLAAARRIAVVGAGLPIPGTAEYSNAAVLIGADGMRVFTQRVPVPLAMWKPFGPKDGVPLRLTGPGTIDIDGHKAAILICYEQLLVWPMLHSALEGPSVLVGMTNATWTKHTSIPAAQRACLKAWSRLFAVPLLIATNN